MEFSTENFRKEVSAFRAAFKDDALGNAEKSLTLEKRGNVGLLIFDAFQERANKLSTPNLLRLSEIFLQVAGDKSIGALVIISRKPSIFIAGADIAEIGRLASGNESVQSLMKLQAVFTYLERLPIPSIAAIHGACVGGGLELSLACDYRMVSDAPETKLGLPEVMLGLIPGWGGTQRLPKLLGLAKSLDLILTGRQVDARSAKKMGLADKLVPKELLEEKALAWAAELAKTKKKRDKQAELSERLIETVPGGKWFILDQAKKKVMEKSHGNYPAPLKAISVIRKTYGMPIEKGLPIEAQGFAELVVTPESKNCIRIYYLTEKVKKDKGVDAKVEAKVVKHAGVVGAGVMGGGIAQLLAAKDVRVRMRDVNWDAITKGYQAAFKIFKKRFDRRKMTQSELDNAMERIEGTTSLTGFKHLDLVIEAIVEDLEIKKKVFQELDRTVGPDTVLASNTSSLSISLIAQACKNPQRVVGMHFFNPVDKMPLVEVIRGKESSDEAVSTVFQFAKRLGKTPIVVKDSPGFVVNRVLGTYLNETVALLLEGVTVVDLDHLMEKFGMPMGPCALLDEVGLDVAGKVAKVLFGAFGDRMKPPPFMDMVLSDGRLGKKNGRGIYYYENGKRKGPDATLLNKVTVNRDAHLTDDIIIKRLIYPMVNEAARILEEGVVRDVSDIDIGMIFGTGFAPFRGGLLRYADTVGPEAIVGDLDLLTRTYGPRFQACNYLQQLAIGNKKFYGEN